MLLNFIKKAFSNPSITEERSNIDTGLEWVHLFYKRIDQNLASTRQGLHTSNQWALTLGIGILTAIVSMSNSSQNFSSEFSLLALLLSFPILLRFFIRSCIEYSIQEKFIILRNETDYFLASRQKSDGDFKRLKECIQYYYFDFKCPTELWKIVKTNFQLNYYWLFIVYLGLIIWNIFSIQGTLYLYVCGAIVVIFVIFEITRFCSYRGFKFHEWPYKHKINIL